MRKLLLACALAIAAPACGSCAGDNPQQQQQQSAPVATNSAPRQIRAPLGVLNLGEAGAPSAAPSASAPSAP